MKFWLMKSEPDVYSIDTMKNDKRDMWEGIRNYQARNFMREMEKGDLALFYHSNTKPPGIAGLVEVCKEHYPDPTQFDKQSNYFDSKSKEDSPRWSTVDVKFVEKFPNYLSLQELRSADELSEMLILRKGNRLSITPVTKSHFKQILKMAGAKTKVRTT